MNAHRLRVAVVNVIILFLLLLTILVVPFSISVAQAAHGINLSAYSTRYEANNGYVYTGRRAQVLHHVQEQFDTHATIPASQSECPTCSADLWTRGARGGVDNTGLQSMNDMAEYIWANVSALGISYVIWNQRISSGGAWKKLDDQGSLTANHKDHVHFTFLNSFQ